MARVPYTPVPDVTPQSVPAPQFRLNVTPAAFGGTIADAVTHLGGDVSKVGGELFQRAVWLQDMNNETDAYNGLAKQELDSGKLREQFLTTQGRNASAGYPGFVQAQQQLRDDTRASLPNDDTRRRFDAMSNRIFNNAAIAGAGHAAGQDRLANTQARTTRIHSLIDSSQEGDDASFQGNLDQIGKLSDSLTTDAGQDPSTANELKFEYQSKAWSARIRALTRTDPVAAKEMFDDAKANNRLHSSDLIPTENAVEAGVNRSVPRAASRGALDEPNNLEGFFKQYAPGSHVQGIDPNFGLRLYHMQKDFQAQNPTATVQYDSMVRTTDEQAALYAKYKAGGGLAAPPGHSLHEKGEAADIQDGAFLDWAHQHAGEYGLEFLPGWRPGEKSSAFANDSGHIQLARGANGEPPARYELPEKFYVDQSVDRMKQQVPEPSPELLDSTIARSQADFRQQHQQQVNQRLINEDTLNNEFARTDLPPPKSIDELLTRSPDIQRAYMALDPKKQLYYQHQIMHYWDQPTPGQNDNYNKLWDMSGATGDPSRVQDFLSTDISKEDLTGKSKTKLVTRQRYLIEHPQDIVNTRMRSAMGYLTGYLPQELVQDKDKFSTFRGALSGAIEDWMERPENKGHYPKPEEVRAMALQMITPPKAADTMLGRWNQYWSGESQSLLDRSGHSNIPEQEHDAISNDYTTKYGLQPSDEMVRMIWLRKQLQKPTK